jgi:hypothetical protein
MTRRACSGEENRLGQEPAGVHLIQRVPWAQHACLLQRRLSLGYIDGAETAVGARDSADSRGSDRLVGALAATGGTESATQYRLAWYRQSANFGHQVDVETAEHHDVVDSVHRLEPTP